MKNNSNLKKITFWTKVNKNNGFRYVFNAPDIKAFLEKNGFCILKFGDILKTIQIVKGIANEVSPIDVFNFCLKYVEDFKNKVLTDEFYKQGETLLLSKKGITGTLVQSENLEISDKKNIAYLFYKNCFLEVCPNVGIILNDYSNLEKHNGFIWKNSIINRDFSANDETCVFENFLKKVTNNQEHYKTIISAIGYLLHRYKNPSLTKIVIISDENTEVEDKANGGTGKGIIMTAIGKFINVSYQNGKNIDFSERHRFSLQNISISTDLIYIDDLKKHFDFEQLFTMATSDMVVEQKQKASYIIPFENSPKLAITSNYRINGDSSSHNRRKYLIFLNNYFSDLYTPQDEFNQLFFTEWDKTEWNRFDTFMIGCINFFLKNGLVEYKQNKELLQKKLKQEIDPYVFQILESKFNELNRYYRLKETTLKTTKQIFLYAEYNGLEFKTRKNNGCTEFMFVKKLNTS